MAKELTCGKNAIALVYENRLVKKKTIKEITLM